MAATVVVHALADPLLMPLGGAVRVQLCVPSFDPDGVAVQDVAVVQVPRDGLVELALTPSSALNPADGWYRVVDPDGTARSIVVPVSSTPVTLESCLVDDPAAPGAVQIGVTADQMAVSIAALAAQYTPLPGLAANGYVPVSDGAGSAAWRAQTDVASAASSAVAAAITGASLVSGTDARIDRQLPSLTGWERVDTDGSNPPNVLGGLKTDGTAVLGVISSPSIPPLEGGATVGAAVPLPSLLSLDVDAATPPNVLAARRSDGSYYIARLSVGELDAPVLTRLSAVACFGDSMFADQGGLGTTTPAQLAAALPAISVYNGGVSGQTSSEVALRAGALDVWFSLAGNAIPAATTATAAFPRIAPVAWKTGSVWDFAGSFSGISGILHKDAADAFTFARTTAGSIVTIPPEVHWDSSEATFTSGDWGVIARGGRNNVDTTIVPRDMRYIRSYVNTNQSRPRFIQLPLYNISTETSGSGGYATVMAINASLEANAGPDYYDLRGWLIRNGLAVMGITPTGGDTAAMAADCIPPSLMYDSTHLNVAGRTAEGIRLAQVLTARGWLS